MNEAKKPGVYKPADKLPQFNEFCMTFINVTLLLRNYLITLTYVLLDDTSAGLYIIKKINTTNKRRIRNNLNNFFKNSLFLTCW